MRGLTIAIAIMLILAGSVSCWSYFRGEQELLEAARQGSLGKAQAILWFDRDLSGVVDRDGTPILSLALSQVKLDTVKLVELFLEHGADPNSRDRMGQTPFHYLVFAKVSPDAGARTVLELCRILKASGGDPTMPDFNGTTPKELAVKQGAEAVSGFFYLEASADSKSHEKP